MVTEGVFETLDVKSETFRFLIGMYYKFKCSLKPFNIFFITLGFYTNFLP